MVAREYKIRYNGDGKEESICGYFLTTKQITKLVMGLYVDGHNGIVSSWDDYIHSELNKINDDENPVVVGMEHNKLNMPQHDKLKSIRKFVDELINKENEKLETIKRFKSLDDGNSPDMLKVMKKTKVIAAGKMNILSEVYEYIEELINDVDSMQC